VQYYRNCQCRCSKCTSYLMFWQLFDQPESSSISASLGNVIIPTGLCTGLSWESKDIIGGDYGLYTPGNNTILRTGNTGLYFFFHPAPPWLWCRVAIRQLRKHYEFKIVIYPHRWYFLPDKLTDDPCQLESRYCRDPDACIFSSSTRHPWTYRTTIASCRPYERPRSI
jgi:hypothetical protein